MITMNPINGSHICIVRRQALALTVNNEGFNHDRFAMIVLQLLHVVMI
jgi:hypothetical protein